MFIDLNSYFSLTPGALITARRIVNMGFYSPTLSMAHEPAVYEVPSKTHLVECEWRLIQVVKSSVFSHLVARSTMARIPDCTIIEWSETAIAAGGYLPH